MQHIPNISLHQLSKNSTPQKTQTQSLLGYLKIDRQFSYDFLTARKMNKKPTNLQTNSQSSLRTNTFSGLFGIQRRYVPYSPWKTEICIGQQSSMKVSAQYAKKSTLVKQIETQTSAGQNTTPHQQDQTLPNTSSQTQITNSYGQ